MYTESSGRQLNWRNSTAKVSGFCPDRVLNCRRISTVFTVGLWYIHMFHLFHLFHRVLMSERYLHVPLVLPVPPAVNIWERVACSTCSTICFSWSIFSTVCLCLGEIRLFYLFHQFHWLSLSGIFFACSTCSTYSTCCTFPPGVYIWESYIFSTCLIC